MNIDFKGIRPVRGSANNGFEELCCQLAACEPVPSGSRFVRNGTPDGGVEAYWVYPDGTERGWQAKYFDELEGKQWQQLDESVEKAVTTHPNLTHYTVCIPLDLPDARVKGKTSLRKKWDERVKKWEGLATGKGRTVSFELWGASELLSRLTQERHAGRRWFWFSRTELSPAWSKNHINEVVAAAGPRYSAELNVELPIALRFDSLGFTPAFQKRLNEVRRQFSKGLKEVVAAFKSVTAYSGVTAARDALGVAGTGLSICLDRFRELIPSAEQFEELLSASRKVRDAEEAILVAMERSSSPSTNPAETAGHRSSTRQPFERQHYALDNFLTAVRTVEDFLDDSSAELAGRPAMLLTGDAGSGKTHLLCDVARLRISAGLPTIVVLGQQLGRGDVWAQIVQRLGFQCTRDEFLGALEAAAEAADGRALILLDAINEASEIDWSTTLPAMLAVVSNNPRIGIAVSCRTTYRRQLVREDLVPARLSSVEHEGFGGRLFEALPAFCRHYDIETLNTPPLHPEFENPLFLKLFCQGLRNRGLKRPPKGHHGLQRIFSFLLDSVNEKLQRPDELDFAEGELIVQRAVNAIADEMLVNNAFVLFRAKVEALLNEILPRAGYSQSLLRKLIGEGVLADDLHWPDRGDEPIHVIRFGYERMADYQFARRLLDCHLQGDSPDNVFADSGPFARIFHAHKAVRRRRGLLSALIVLVPERTGKELSEWMPALQTTPGFVEAFLESLPWREGEHVTQHAIGFIETLLAEGDPRTAAHSTADEVLERILLMAPQPDHPLNARWLHARLLALPIAERDLVWSTFLHRSWQAQQQHRPSVIGRLIEWAWPENLDDEPSAGLDDQVGSLAATVLIWCLTSSNRYVRDRATKALVCVLRARLNIVPALLADFDGVDDPYVLERLYCAIFGAVLASNDLKQIGTTAFAVYRRVFEKERPPAHVLLRDYARCTVEYALSIGCQIDAIDSRIRPPYRSDAVQSDLPAWKQLAQQYRSIGYMSITGSLDPSNGDFARYVLRTDSHGVGLHTWTDQPDPFTEYRRLNDEVPKLPSPLAARWFDFVHGDLLARPQAREQAEDRKPADEGIDSISRVEENAQKASDGKDLQHEHVSLALEAFLSTISSEEAALIAEHEQAVRARDFALRAANAMWHSQCLESDFASRWILTRVVELGWTPERFSAFDDAIRRAGRSAQKAERIGKKYQWLAYHELAARILDHRSYRHDSTDGSQAYEGPWQNDMRDIDPTFLAKEVISNSDDGVRWWVPVEDPLRPVADLEDRVWLNDKDSIPDFAPLLSVGRVSSSSSWCPLEASWEWKESAESLERRGEGYQRHLTFSLSAFLLPNSQLETFIAAVRSGEWNGLDIDAQDFHGPFLGEFAWAPSYREYIADAEVDKFDQLDQNSRSFCCVDGAPFSVASTVMRYVHSGGSFDCSLTESCSTFTPSAWLARRMQLKWGRRRFEFLGPKGNLLAFDPSVVAGGPSALVIDQDALLKFVTGSGFALVWLLIGEKLLLSDEPDYRDKHPRISVFRQVFSMPGDGQPRLESRTFGYLGEHPTAY
jgi:hypothetical protein